MLARRILLCLPLLPLMTTGCSSSTPPPAGRPATIKVQGTVMHKGAPVPGASVSLRFKGDGPGASGIADDKGQFQLTTYSAGDGVVPGAYLVGVTKTEVSGVDNSYFDVAGANYGKTPPPEAYGKTTHHLPEKYNNPDTSGLSVTIAPDQKELTIEVPE